MKKNTTKNGKITMSAEYSPLVDSIVSCGIEIFGFCNYDEVLPLLPCRAVARLPLNPKSIIVCAFPYLVREPNNIIKNISYYACVPDYHIVVMNILKKLSTRLAEVYPNYQFEPFADSSPIREVKASQLAGLGCVGKNGLLITEKYGSYVFLGEIVTNMPLECTSYSRQCVGCGLCEIKCPTNSLSGGRVCEKTCLSAVTQKKGELSLEEQSLMREYHTAWGCDNCQTICPMNRHANETTINEFINHAQHVLNESNISKEGAYFWRGRKTILRNINILDS
jgi:epoxyqueuosine reductase